MADNTIIRFEGYELDPASRSLHRDGQLVALTPKTFDLLLFLASHPHKVVPKDKLLSAVWPDSFVEESNLSQHIFLLRKALAAGAAADRASERIVVTVPGKGYQFTAAVEEVDQASQASQRRSVDSALVSSPDPYGSAARQPDGAYLLHTVRSVTSVVVEEETEDLSEPSSRHEQLALAASSSSRKKWLWATSLVILLCVAVAGYFLSRGLHPESPTHVDLVLAELENTTGDQDFNHSLNQALQIDLEQSPYIHLLSRSAVRDTLAQMQRRSDEPLTPALAQEVCQRNNLGVMLHGAISRLGSQYLLLLNAESCISGKHLAGYKAQVASKDEVLTALDKAAAAVRKQLGESAASREQYQTSIAQATTPSFEALLAYNQAGESFRRGDMKASQLLNQRAVALDPNFASAYRILGSSYYNLGDYAQAATYYKKAFDLRERTTERERLGIEVMYYAYALNDYEESIRRTRQFLQIYPNVANSWVSLANLYVRLGQYPQAMDAGEHAIRVDPHSGVAAVELARAYLHASRFGETKAIAHAALAQGKDHWDLHSMLFQIAFAEQDAAQMQAEGNWGLTHQHINTSLRDLALAAASQGKLREANDDFARAHTEALRGSDTDFANGTLLAQATVLTQLGQPAQATAILKQMTGDPGDPGDPGLVALLKASNGDLASAQHYVNSISLEEKNTVKVYIYAPLIRAQLALKAYRPADAIHLLEPARPYQLLNFSIPYLRAEAEAQAGNLNAAAEDYHLILANPGVDAISPLYPLAHLQLARTLAAQRQFAASRAEYQAFLKAWKDADPDQPILLQAKQEFARLPAFHA